MARLAAGPGNILGAVSDADGSTLLAVRVIPRAGRLVVRTTAAPVDDKANVAVCRQVAEYLGVPVRHVRIASGHHSRDKLLRIGP
jgi:uncharacterized protein YggU (UPF0235/DUF167 family)